ncbi:hypothetical protein [Bifidobacterium olomucense]|uniref:Tail assembly chaperone n=1 Tax=Bifidobacterium olomucense TaxID=2675324 RepID=A0A7Y0EZM6_9BIFI|nr:hypothetical protein [Bifidobacterium sp. DSM 109959]NMM99325.1 hypothetical protein [Bifidobacterium sp. DSM 109959]
MRRVYGLGVYELRPLETADLAANLPAGSLVWQELDIPAAWSVDQYLLALQIDQMNMWMWGNADPKKRGPKPRPLPRPGQGAPSTRDDGKPADGHERHVRRIEVQPMTIAEFQRWRAQRFSDERVEKSRPLAGT